jgi:RNA polymerase sigma-70 factor (ECF subfamily)
VVPVDVEAEVRRLCDANELRSAVTAAIEGYGPELLGFLVVVVGDASEAGDVFADTCVRLWKSLPSFRWDSSLRTWVYVLARRACHAHRKERAKHRERYVRLSEVPEIDAMIARVRTTTSVRLAKQEGTTRAERLRAKLELDEQMLLTLRVDRELEWRAIAQIMSDETLEDDALTREAASLRKRFERIKEKLKKLAATEPP